MSHFYTDHLLHHTTVYSIPIVLSEIAGISSHFTHKTVYSTAYSTLTRRTRD